MMLKTTYHSQLSVADQISYKTCNRIMIKNKTGNKRIEPQQPAANDMWFSASYLFCAYR